MAMSGKRICWMIDSGGDSHGICSIEQVLNGYMGLGLPS